MNAGKVNKSVLELKEAAVEADPDSAEAHNNLGLIYGKYEGRYGKAVDEFRRAIEIDSKFPDARNNLAIACYLLGDDGQAWRHLKVARLLGATPDPILIDALRSGGVNGRVKAQAVGWSPSAEALAARRRSALVLASVIIAAVACAVYFIPRVSRYAKVKPNIPAFRSDQLEARLAAGLFDEVIAECKRVVKVRSTDVTIYNLLAQAYHGKGMWDEEISQRKKVIKLSPDWPKTEWAALYNNLGVAYIEKGEYDKAIEECRRAIGFWSEDAEAYNNLGYAFGQKGELDKAVKMYKSAVEFKPEFKEAHYNLALTLAQAGRFEEAWKEVRLAEELGYPAKPLIDELTKVFPEHGQLEPKLEERQKIDETDKESL